MIAGSNQGPFSPDYVSAAELDGVLDADAVERLSRGTALVALNGTPCWETPRLAEALEAHRREGGAL
jgi:hypothetical protein